MQETQVRSLGQEDPLEKGMVELCCERVFGFKTLLKLKLYCDLLHISRIWIIILDNIYLIIKTTNWGPII